MTLVDKAEILAPVYEVEGAYAAATLSLSHVQMESLDRPVSETNKF